MPAAPDRETVMDFEGALEQGFQALYTTAGLTTYIRNSTYDPEGTPVADTHTEISVEVGPADENQVDFDPDGVGYYAAYQFSLSIRHWVQLDTAHTLSFAAIVTKMDELRARTRVELEFGTRPAAWTTDVAPYHDIAELVPEGSIRETDAEKQRDFLEMRYRGTVTIRPGSMPAS